MGDFTLEPQQEDVVCVDLEGEWSEQSRVFRHPEFQDGRVAFVVGEVGEGGDHMNITFRNLTDKQVTIAGDLIVVIVNEDPAAVDTFVTKGESEGAEADKEAKLKAETEAKKKSEKEAKERAEKDAKVKADKEAKDKAEKEANEKAEKEDKEKAEKEAKVKAEKEVKVKADKEAKVKAEKEAKEKVAKEAKV